MNPTYEKIAEILRGINLTETDDASGWWETSEQAKHGGEKLMQIKALFDAQESIPFTFPCSREEATELAAKIRSNLSGEWNGVSGIKDGVDLGLAARVIDAYRYNLNCCHPLQSSVKSER